MSRPDYEWFLRLADEAEEPDGWTEACSIIAPHAARRVLRLEKLLNDAIGLLGAVKAEQAEWLHKAEEALHGG